MADSPALFWRIYFSSFKYIKFFYFFFVFILEYEIKSDLMPRLLSI